MNSSLRAADYTSDQKPVFCKRCLLSELTDKQLYQTVQEYIMALPEHTKAAPDEYRRRLLICAQCDELINGTCRQCGCFVEARAAKQNATCAKSAKIW